MIRSFFVSLFILFGLFFGVFVFVFVENPNFFCVSLIFLNKMMFLRISGFVSFVNLTFDLHFSTSGGAILKTLILLEICETLIVFSALFGGAYICMTNFVNE